MTTISVLGSGSVEFGRSLVADLLTSPQLAGARLVLHDIDAERLDTSYRIAQATAASVGSDSVIVATPELGAALDGADYVVNQINVGGFAATRLDFEIPHRHGVRQTISDTLGIGGIFRGLRTIPVVLGIAAEMQRRCPDAWLLNYTNPMTMVPWAVYEAFPRVKVVGVCHSVRDTQTVLADIVGVPEQEITFLTAGVNHQAFVLRFEHEGRDLYPRLREIVEGSPALQQKVKFEIFRRLGYVPTESSEHGAEYVPWFLPHPDMVERHAIPIGAYLGWFQEVSMSTTRSGAGSTPARTSPSNPGRSWPPWSSRRSRADHHGCCRATCATTASSTTCSTARASRCRAWSTATACSPPTSALSRRSWRR